MKRQTYATLLTAVCLCGALGSASVNAADPKWYAQADLGVSLVNNTDIGQFVNATGGEMKFDAGFASGLTAGYHFTPWLAAEFQTGYMLNGLEGVDAVLSQCPLMVNLTYELRKCGKFVPFVGVGAGGLLSILSIDDRVVAGEGTVRVDGSDADLLFAYQAFGGMRYNFNDRMSVGFLYRFRGTGGPSWDVEDWFTGETIGKISFDDVFSHAFTVLFNFRL
jgi:opacity protein-like surface antigen